MTELTLIRGLPGSGKYTRALNLCRDNWSTNLMLWTAWNTVTSIFNDYMYPTGYNPALWRVTDGK